MCDTGMIIKMTSYKLGMMVAHTCKPNPMGAETGGGYE